MSRALLAAYLGIFLGEGAGWAQTDNGSQDRRSPVRADASLLAGDRPGADLGGYRVGGFAPLLWEPRSLLFVDGTGMLDENSSDFAGDIGLGYRQAVGDTVLGGNVFYNYRNEGAGSSSVDFSTAGFGFEALSSRWSLRANAFFGLNGAQSLGDGFATVTPRYVQEANADPGVQNILLGVRTDRIAEALDGGDLTLTRKFPSLFSEIGGGVYFLSADQGEDSFGGQLTIDCTLTSQVNGHVNVSHDELFETSVSGGISFHFGGPAINVRSRSDNLVSRFWSRVQRRRVAPILTTDRSSESVFATDATTGDLISVTQLDTGDDIVSQPDRREADGDYVDIILADPGSTFSPLASIQLRDDQRLLSADIPHLIDTSELGVISLPESGLGGPASTIAVTLGIQTVVLADRNEVRGFFFDTSGIGSF